MDAPLDAMTAPYRDARYAPRQLTVERRGGGTIVLTHPGGFFRGFTRMTDALAHWAERAPDRIWLAERSGEGWWAVTRGASGRGRWRRGWRRGVCSATGRS